MLLTQTTCNNVAIFGSIPERLLLNGVKEVNDNKHHSQIYRVSSKTLTSCGICL